MEPFFILEKDRIRTSQQFDPRLIYTSITVKGGLTDRSGVMDSIMNDQFMQQMTFMNRQSQAAGTQGSNITKGLYIANGFQTAFDPGSPTTKAKDDLDQTQKALNDSVFVAMCTSLKDQTVTNLLDSYITNIQELTATPTSNFYSLFSAAAVTMEQALVSTYGANYETTATPDEIRATVQQTLFPHLLTDTLAQTIGATIHTTPAPAPQSSATDAQKNQAMNTTIRMIVGGMDAYTTYQQSLSNAQVQVSTNQSAATMEDLLRLSWPTLVNEIGTQDVILWTIALESAQANYNKWDVSKLLVRTLADCQDRAEAGLYDQRLDMIKHYGYNAGPPITNPYIKTGQEAQEYARIVFNRLKGKAIALQVDLIGRPEFCLNRPYYCERKDAIGLLSSYTLKYAYGSDFSSSATLEYIRKNTITYSYSLGSLDPFLSPVNNDYFKRQANDYYKWNSTMSTLNSKATSRVSKAVSGSNPGMGRAAVAHMTSNLTSSALNSIMPAGGVFVAHDRIGHIPFDTRFGEDTAAATAALSSAMSKQQVHPPKNLVDMADAITTRITRQEQINGTGKSDATVSTIDSCNKKIQTADANYTEAVSIVQSNYAIVSDPATTTEDRQKAQIALNSARLKLNKAIQSQNDAAQALSAVNNEVTLILTALYGIPEDLNSIVLNFNISATYETLHGLYKGEPPITVPDANVYATGLYYQLYDAHRSMYNTTGATFTVVKEGAPDSSYSGTAITYYIKSTFPAPPAAASGPGSAPTSHIATKV